MYISYLGIQGFLKIIENVIKLEERPERAMLYCRKLYVQIIPY